MPDDQPRVCAAEQFSGRVGKGNMFQASMPSAATDPTATSRPAATTARVTFLDTLRFIAAGAVLFQHVAEKSGKFGAWATALLSPGVFGVVLFFVVSGFVIPMTAGRRFDLKTFAIRRVFRIYPLVLVAFALLALLGYGSNLTAFSYVSVVAVRTWVVNLMLVQDYFGAEPLLGVTWTLSIEFAWYAVFALALLRFGRRFDDKLIVIAPVVELLLCCISLLIGHRLPLARIGLVYVAILGCRVFHAHEGSLTPRRLYIDAGVFSITMAISNLVSFGYYHHPHISLYEALIPWLVAPALFLLVACVPAIRHSPLISNRFTGWLGSISFSTYLLHPFAMGLASSLVPPGLFSLACVLLTLVLSVLGYRFVELPGQALGKRIIAATK
ncbi:acyltransferase family protein [Paraburkholderia silviterrae]|uniref:Acyltransferase n=1 Tax=Paraburkholderia silviterrae TaxID=2528715 RepID=A0A4R5M879_9BURK|nr:acyltransferase [Paraburkholderia silviterrae]TDG22484.1 acyltransferase [Paraburkholderia silviterrae]